nr:hepatitis A virus cellular receptor 1 [uncultured Prevotella sp.]
MKKFTSFLTVALMALMSLTFTSCDEDADIAYTLDGTWSGYMNTSVSYNNRKYYSSTADITFNAGYDSGDGYWLDTYSNAPWDYVANRITWQVRNGMIYIYFRDTREDAVIRNYHLDDRYFYGEIEFNSTNAWIEFKFVKTSSPNWNRYYWYGTNSWLDSWGGSYDYGWSKTSKETNVNVISRSAEGNDSIPALIRRVEK